MKKVFILLFLVWVVLLVLPTQVNAAEREDSDFIAVVYEARVINCNSGISLYYAPSSNSEKMTNIPFGTIVKVYDLFVEGIDGFYPVKYNGMCGYCLKDYLKPLNDNE